MPKTTVTILVSSMRFELDNPIPVAVELIKHSKASGPIPETVELVAEGLTGEPIYYKWNPEPVGGISIPGDTDQFDWSEQSMAVIRAETKKALYRFAEWTMENR